MAGDFLNHREIEPNAELKVPQDLVNRFWLVRHPELSVQDQVARKAERDSLMEGIIKAYLVSRGFPEATFEQEKGVWDSTRVYFYPDKKKYIDLNFENTNFEDYHSLEIVFRVAPEDRSKIDLKGDFVLRADQDFIEAKERASIEEWNKREEQMTRFRERKNNCLKEIFFKNPEFDTLSAAENPEIKAFLWEFYDLEENAGWSMSFRRERDDEDKETDEVVAKIIDKDGEIKDYVWFILEETEIETKKPEKEKSEVNQETQILKTAVNALFGKGKRPGLNLATKDMAVRGFLGKFFPEIKAVGQAGIKVRHDIMRRKIQIKIIDDQGRVFETKEF